jgi:hypothetical protein
MVVIGVSVTEDRQHRNRRHARHEAISRDAAQDAVAVAGRLPTDLRRVTCVLPSDLR